MGGMSDPHIVNYFQVNTSIRNSIKLVGTSSVLMANQESSKLVGCLLHVWACTRSLQCCARCSPQYARKEQQGGSNAKIFVGAFGLDRTAGYPPTVDLCGIAETLIGDIDSDDRSGHNLLIGIANENNLAHITEYIRTKLTDNVARIVYGYLRRHPERISEFIEAIPSADETRNLHETKNQATSGLGSGLIVGGLAMGGLLRLLAAVGLGVGAKIGADIYEGHAVDSSQGLQLARQICREWFEDFVDLIPRPVVMWYDYCKSFKAITWELVDAYPGPSNSLYTVILQCAML